jgi:plasmid stabilization system protein ParE
MVANRTPLIWSPEAIADLESIWDFYIDAAGQRTAENVVREIAETCGLKGGAGASSRQMGLNPPRLRPGRIAQIPLPDGCEEFPDIE